MLNDGHYFGGFNLFLFFIVKQFVEIFSLLNTRRIPRHFDYRDITQIFYFFWNPIKMEKNQRDLYQGMLQFFFSVEENKCIFLSL